MTKVCSRCGSEKPLADFGKSPRKRDGVHAWCKACLCDRARQYRLTNLAKCREADRNYRKRNPERVAQVTRNYRAANTEKISKAKRKYREANAVKLRHYHRRHAHGTDGVAELNAQGGVCAICKTSLSLNSRSTCVDHCHASGLVRGVLCSRCNNLLGMAKDDVRVLRAAIDYLESTGVFS